MAWAGKADAWLRPLTTQADRHLLERWARRPHIVQWWGPPEESLAELRRAPRQGGEALIVAGERPVGYLRWQVPEREHLENAGLGDLAEGVVDIDIGIGEPDWLGRGIGSQALALLVERLRKELDPPMYMMCTSVRNARAQRAFQRAGFRRERMFDDPVFGPMWLFLLP